MAWPSETLAFSRKWPFRLCFPTWSRAKMRVQPPRPPGSLGWGPGENTQRKPPGGTAKTKLGAVYNPPFSLFLVLTCGGSAMFTTKMFITKKKSVAPVLITWLAVLCVIPAWSQEKLDLETISRIRYEGFRDSKVMDFATGLMDSIRWSNP